MTTAKDIMSTEFPRGKRIDTLTQRERWEQWTPPKTIEDCVKLLFEILDAEETSDAGRDFRPTYISSCRVWDTHRLARLLPKLKELAQHPPTNP